MRNFSTSTASLGLLFDLQSYEPLADVNKKLLDDSRSEIIIGHQKIIFNGRSKINSTARYALNRGNTRWGQLQLTAEISVNF
jgi:hypothetical protein